MSANNGYHSVALLITYAASIRYSRFILFFLFVVKSYFCHFINSLIKLCVLQFPGINEETNDGKREFFFITNIWVFSSFLIFYFIFDEITQRQLTCECKLLHIRIFSASNRELPDSLGLLPSFSANDKINLLEETRYVGSNRINARCWEVIWSLISLRKYLSSVIHFMRFLQNFSWRWWIVQSAYRKERKLRRYHANKISPIGSSYFLRYLLSYKNCS